ncbi:GNA1 [Enterospora canceri]|uniref:Glucosamine 6-phosphate N-acetyltransferase n=1 Tax=Enterospora canceri TaxID=1081671 RepID=A0A1Y1S6J1_9MICR|nr:GNA1 [Enterospora canceri]
MLIYSILRATCAATTIIAGETEYNIRKLTTDDVKKPEFICLFGELTTTDETTEEVIVKTFERKEASGLHHQLGLFTSDGTVVGTLTVLLDPKYAKNGRPAAFIEDVIVAEKHRGKELATYLMKEAEDISTKNGAYKMILSCNEALSTKETSPYLKSGFTKDCCTMRKNLKKEEKAEEEAAKMEVSD